MKIMFFLPHADDGIIRSTIPIIEGFNDKGYVTEVVTLQAKGRMTDQLDIVSKVHRINASRTFFAIHKFSQHLRTNKPDIVISAQHFANISALLAKVLSRQNIRLIFTERTSIQHSLEQIHWFKRFITKLLIKNLYTFADSVVANSDGVKKELIRFLGVEETTVKLIYNPTFDSKVYKNDPVTKSVHPWFGIPNVPVILGVGRLSLEKNFTLLIKAFSLLNKNTRAKLIILGDGPEKQSLTNLIKTLNIEEDCQLLGHVNNPYDFMKLSSLLVLSSNYEGLPNVLIEGQACKIPVISTDCPHGPSEILLDGKAGSLTPMNDYVTMSSKMFEILSNPKIAEAYVKTASENLYRFQPKLALDKYDLILKKVNQKEN